MHVCMCVSVVTVYLSLHLHAFAKAGTCIWVATVAFNAMVCTLLAWASNSSIGLRTNRYLKLCETITTQILLDEYYMGWCSQV